MLLRTGPAARLAAGPFVGRYGGSQAGGVLRYRLSPSSRRPALYARATAALNSVGERELAVGFSARPLARLPLAVQIELRASRLSGRTQLRPSAFAVSELNPLALPFGARAEIYGQAGYVGGRFATPFVDGQVRIDREVADLGSAKLRLGGGVWGGAQKGAAALDIGPGAVVELSLGETPARIALDYRLRATGAAAPRDGFALTLSTGF